MSIAEVEKLWLRFQQMECNPSGVTSSLEIKVELYMLDYLFQWVSLRWRDCGWGFSRWDVTPALRRKKKGCTLHVGLLVSVSVAEVETYLWLRFQQMGCNASAWEKTHTKVALYMLDYLFQWVLLRWRDCGWGFSRWDAMRMVCLPPMSSTHQLSLQMSS